MTMAHRTDHVRDRALRELRDADITSRRSISSYVYRLPTPPRSPLVLWRRIAVAVALVVWTVVVFAVGRLGR